MKLTYKQVAELAAELNGDGKETKGLLKQLMSWKAKAQLNRLNDAVMDELKIFDNLRKELFQKWGDEKDGAITIPPDKIADFQPEFEELLLIEKDFHLDTLWSTPLTVKDFEKLETAEYYPICYKLIKTDE